MFKKLSDKFSKGIIYLAAFLVTALMAVMMIHIVKESIPAISQLGIKMFLPTTEWRPVSQKPQYGLLPAIAGTYGSCKSLCHPPPYGSRSMYPGSRDCAGDHAFTIRYFHLS